MTLTAKRAAETPKGAATEVVLRELTRADVRTVNRWRADREVASTLVGTFRHVNVETDEQWFDRYLASRDREVRLAVTVGEGDKVVGVVYLLGIDWVNRSAEFGIMVGERDLWGQGIGTEAGRLAVRHAFRDLNLRRLSLVVLEDNERAVRLYERLGFAREGVLREAVYKDGHYSSLLAMALLREERGHGHG